MLRVLWLDVCGHHHAMACRAPLRSDRDVEVCTQRAWSRRRSDRLSRHAARAHASSRSHLLFIVRLTRTTSSGAVFQNTAHLVDLAGSERLGLSRAAGNQNLSLCMLTGAVTTPELYHGPHLCRRARLDEHVTAARVQGLCVTRCATAKACLPGNLCFAAPNSRSCCVELLNLSALLV